MFHAHLTNEHKLKVYENKNNYYLITANNQKQMEEQNRMSGLSIPHDRGVILIKQAEEDTMYI